MKDICTNSFRSFGPYCQVNSRSTTIALSYMRSICVFPLESLRHDPRLVLGFLLTGHSKIGNLFLYSEERKCIDRLVKQTSRPLVLESNSAL